MNNRMSLLTVVQQKGKRQVSNTCGGYLNGGEWTII